VHAGMDQYAVLVFHGPAADRRAAGSAFTRSLGEIEHGDRPPASAEAVTGCRPTFADVVEPGRGTNQVFPRAEQPHAASSRSANPPSGTPTARSRWSPAKLLAPARSVRPVEGRQHRVRGHARWGYDALDDETKAAGGRPESGEHSQLYSARCSASTDFTDEERRSAAFQSRCARSWCGHAPRAHGRKSLYLSSHAGRHRGLAGAGGRAAFPGATSTRSRTQRQVRPTPTQWRVGEPRDVGNNRQNHAPARGPFPRHEPRGRAPQPPFQGVGPDHRAGSPA